MKARLLLLVIHLLTGVHLISGQEFRDYTEGPLAYEDFKGHPLDIDSLTGEIYFDYDYMPTKHKINGISSEKITYKVGINTEQSWLKVEGIDESVLNYFQVLFDIEYLYIKKLNAEQSNFDTDMQSRSHRYQSDRDIMRSKFEAESLGGRRADIVSKWRQRLMDDIAAVKTTENDAVVTSTYGMDMHFGVGRLMKSGTAKEAFGNPMGLGMGFNFNLKNTYIILSGGFGFGDLDQTLQNRPYWEEGIATSHVNFLLGAGRSFTFNRVKLIPHIAAAVNDVYINKNEYENVYDDLRSVRWNLGAGLFVDVPIIRSYKFRSSWGNAQQVYHEHGIRLAVQGSLPVTYYKQYKGTNLFVGLHYYFYFGNLEQVK